MSIQIIGSIHVEFQHSLYDCYSFLSVVSEVEKVTQLHQHFYPKQKKKIITPNRKSNVYEISVMIGEIIPAAFGFQWFSINRHPHNPCYIYIKSKVLHCISFLSETKASNKSTMLHPIKTRI